VKVLTTSERQGRMEINMESDDSQVPFEKILFLIRKGKIYNRSGASEVRFLLKFEDGNMYIVHEISRENSKNIFIEGFGIEMQNK
jgi:hypothetical protein